MKQEVSLRVSVGTLKGVLMPRSDGNKRWFKELEGELGAVVISDKIAWRMCTY